MNGSRPWVRLVAVFLPFVSLAAVGRAAAQELTARELAVIMNTDDPLSVQIGNYYVRRRAIPAENVLRLRTRHVPVLTATEFHRIQRELDARVPEHVQAYALTWSLPFRVQCMSITSAFAYGFDPTYCADGCSPTPSSPYFDSASRRPFADLNIRPTMMVTADSFTQARALIDRGIASDGTAPRGTAYLLNTSDSRRNVRAPSFSSARLLEREGLRVEILRSDVLSGRKDVLFYFTGAVHVPELDRNSFLPGAIGDHLTSAGGVLSGSRQMSSLKWIAAGATGSYGTVVEPCAIPAKFPNVPVVMRRYLAGETLIEAYWKSVAMPSQGLFLGEPLAAPFRRTRTGLNHTVDRQGNTR